LKASVARTSKAADQRAKQERVTKAVERVANRSRQVGMMIAASRTARQQGYQEGVELAREILP
jgi:hypothetical protein